MSLRVGYLRRAASGGLVRAVRLVGERTSEQWDAPLEEARDVVDVADAIDQARGAAAWMAERIRQGSGGKLGPLIVDVDGASCSWLTVPSDEAAVVGAALEQSESSPLGEKGLAPAGMTGAGTSVQAIAPGGAPAGVKHAAGHRRAVLCVPDAIVRVVLDELDAKGTPPASVLSLWHAIALAWDPGAGREASASGNERIVASSEQTTGVAVVDDEGTLAWSWTRSGRLIACGRLRLGGGAAPRVGASDVARLTSDWLAWTLQCGQGPTRIVCVTPELEAEDEDLSPAGVGERLGAAWPGASVDMAVVGDPLGETLSRLASDRAPAPHSGSRADEGLVGLSHRPGRAHRRLHLTMALATLVLGAALATHGVLQMRLGGRARDEADRVRTDTYELVRRSIPNATRAFLTRQVDAELGRLAASEPTGELRPAMPILEELDRIAFALSTMGPKWDGLEMYSDFLTVAVTAYFDEGDIESAEMLKDQLNAMPGTYLTPWSGTATNDRGRLRYTLTANWDLDKIREAR